MSLSSTFDNAHNIDIGRYSDGDDGCRTFRSGLTKAIFYNAGYAQSKIELLQISKIYGSRIS